MAHQHKKHGSADDESTIAVKVGAAALTFAAGWLAQKLLTQVWKGVTGKEAPKDADDPEVGIASAVAFAALAAGIGVVARRLASRNAKRVVTRFVAKA